MRVWGWGRLTHRQFVGEHDRWVHLGEVCLRPCDGDMRGPGERSTEKLPRTDSYGVLGSCSAAYLVNGGTATMSLCSCLSFQPSEF